MLGGKDVVNWASRDGCKNRYQYSLTPIQPNFPFEIISIPISRSKRISNVLLTNSAAIIPMFTPLIRGHFIPKLGYFMVYIHLLLFLH